MKQQSNLTWSRAMVLCALLCIITSSAFAQIINAEDILSEVDSQLSSVTSIITKICYTIAGICFFVGAITVGVKLYQGNQNVGKEIGLYFAAMAFFGIAGYLVQKFFE